MHQIIDERHTDATPSIINSADDLKHLNEDTFEYVMANTIGAEVRTVLQAMKTPDWPQWKESMNDEIHRLKQCNTWTIIDNPNDNLSAEEHINIVRSKWVFKDA
jgi:hypothetical protein